MKLVDMTGQRFGRLVVVCRANNIGRQVAWLCKCDCGNEKISPGWNLRSGQCVSCGCYAAETRGFNAPVKHGQSYTRLYSIWIGMKQRCYYPKHKHYDRYGGRGIRVCAEWVDCFEQFYSWSMENGYKEELTIDRINVDCDYSPNNCRWASYKTQNNNTSKTRMLSLNGQVHSVQEWSELTGIPYSTITGRLQRGWTIEKALAKRDHLK